MIIYENEYEVIKGVTSIERAGYNNDIEYPGKELPVAVSSVPTGDVVNAQSIFHLRPGKKKLWS